MKKPIRITAIVLCLAMLVGVLVGCAHAEATEVRLQKLLQPLMDAPDFTFSNTHIQTGTPETLQLMHDILKGTRYEVYIAPDTDQPETKKARDTISLAVINFDQPNMAVQLKYNGDDAEIYTVDTLYSKNTRLFTHDWGTEDGEYVQVNLRPYIFKKSDTKDTSAPQTNNETLPTETMWTETASALRDSTFAASYMARDVAEMLDKMSRSSEYAKQIEEKDGAFYLSDNPIVSADNPDEKIVPQLSCVKQDGKYVVTTVLEYKDARVTCIEEYTLKAEIDIPEKSTSAESLLEPLPEIN